MSPCLWLQVTWDSTDLVTTNTIMYTSRSGLAYLWLSVDPRLSTVRCWHSHRRSSQLQCYLIWYEWIKRHLISYCKIDGQRYLFIDLDRKRRDDVPLHFFVCDDAVDIKDRETEENDNHHLPIILAHYSRVYDRWRAVGFYIVVSSAIVLVCWAGLDCCESIVGDQLFNSHWCWATFVRNQIMQENIEP